MIARNVSRTVERKALPVLTKWKLRYERVELHSIADSPPTMIRSDAFQEPFPNPVAD